MKLGQIRKYVDNILDNYFIESDYSKEEKELLREVIPNIISKYRFDLKKFNVRAFIDYDNIWNAYKKYIKEIEDINEWEIEKIKEEIRKL